MMRGEPDFSALNPDDVDGALEDLWRGRSVSFERLLDSTGSSWKAVDRLFGDVLACGLPDPGVEPPPTLTNYTIVREIGRGGMGVVYEARQHHPARSVALKVNRLAGARHPLQVKLFEREIRSLARLRHPGIAAIYDAGLTTEGRPYFAMEFLEGVTLVEFVRRFESENIPHSRRIHVLLTLFENLCTTISFAHQRGVIHRDLKPSNIFVLPETSGGSRSDGTPQIKILDFGLARITDSETPETLLTEVGQLRGTIAYMAPELLQGDPAEADTRSDVYSLGVMLFEMLTGALPYDIKGKSVVQVLRTVCDTSPSRPSSINSHLRGDLETIILRAIAREPAQRYTGADTLAEDIARFRANLPILARPHSAMYQLRKLVRRHRVAAFALLAVLAVSVIGFAVSAMLYVRAERARAAEQTQRLLAEQQRVEASTEARRAAAVTRFVSEMLSAADPDKSGRDARVVDVLDAATERLEAEALDAPEVEATIRHVIGLTYLKVGEAQKAERHFQKAVELRLTHLDADSWETQDSRQNLASTIGLLGRHDEAEALSRDVVERVRLVRGDEDPLTLQAMNALGMTLIQCGKLEEAEVWLRRVVEAQSRTLGVDHADTLVSMSGLGILLQERHKLDEAESLFRHVAEQRRSQFPEQHPRRLVAEENLASVLHDQGRLAEAEPMFVQLLGASRVVLGNEHPRTLVLINTLAQVYQDQGRFDAAQALFEENLETRTRAFGREQQGTLVALSNLASLHHAAERFAQAEPLYREAIEIGTRILPADHWYLSAFRSNLGACLLKMGQWQSAAGELEIAHAGLVRALGADHPRSVRAQELLQQARDAL